MMASQKFPKEILVVKRSDNRDAPYFDVYEMLEDSDIEDGEVVAVYRFIYMRKVRLARTFRDPEVK